LGNALTLERVSTWRQRGWEEADWWLGGREKDKTRNSEERRAAQVPSTPVLSHAYENVIILCVNKPMSLFHFPKSF
jgi:hypothetical protein